MKKEYLKMITQATYSLIKDMEIKIMLEAKQKCVKLRKEKIKEVSKVWEIKEDILESEIANIPSEE